LMRVLAVAHSAGVAVGAYCADAEMARRLAETGFDLVTPGNDVVLLKDSAAQRIAVARGTPPTEVAAGGY